ncbi:DUF4347 domain-containing protein [Synechococcus sp. CC9616]|uniref:DUF4347 domain-containing protein n=1 Tax=Synechococcus sp. CC9616 TaxID=110663 RepID=UPI0004B9B8C0|nr:DUF4347 domain-containing protein [Synechococcus sp. CC9616]
MTSVALDCTRDALVLGDASCSGIRQLLDASLFPAAKLTTNLSPLAAITKALQQQRARGLDVRTLHLIAHGDPGVVWVGNQPIDCAALLANSELLASWGLKQIALWSCHVGADGDFIALLAELTGADVFSSADSLDRFAVLNEVVPAKYGELKTPGMSIAYIADPFMWPESFRLGRKRKSQSRAAVQNLEVMSVGDTFFGVDQVNDVWQINPTFEEQPDIGQAFIRVLNLSDPIPTGDEEPTKLITPQGSGEGANGVAFDTEEDYLYFFYKGVVDGDDRPPNSNSEWNIIWWPIGEEQEWGWINPPGNNFGSNNSIPANASFYDGSLWYFGGGNSKKLYQLKLDYEVGPVPAASQLIAHEVKKYPPGGYGDIAIDMEGILYGSQSNNKDGGRTFFSIDLKQLISPDDCPDGDCNPYKLLNSNLTVEKPDSKEKVSVGLQLSFNESYDALFGQTYDNKGGGYIPGAFYVFNFKENDEGFERDELGNRIINPVPQYTGYSVPDLNEYVGRGFTDLGGATNSPAPPLPPDFTLEAAGASCDNESGAGLNTKGLFKFDVILDNLSDWEYVFREQDFYGPFDFDLTLVGDGGSSEAFSLDSSDIKILNSSGKSIGLVGSSGPDENEFFVDKKDDDGSGVSQFIFEASLPIASLESGDAVKLDLMLAVTGEEKSAQVISDGLEECFPGAIESIKGKAVCDDEAASSEQEAAQFLFNVEREETDDVQYYQYELGAAGLEGGTYEVQHSDLIAFAEDGSLVDEGVEIVERVDEDVLDREADAVRTGYIKVQGNVRSFDAEILLSGENFVGNEEITLTLTNAYESPNGDGIQTIGATAVEGAAALNDDCILPLPSAGEVQRVEATSACELDGTSSKKDAVFKFEVSFDPVGTEAQLYGYSFEALGEWSESGYRLQEIVFPDDVALRPSSKTAGKIVVPAGMETFEVDVYVKSNQVLTGEEALALTISNNSSEAKGSNSLKDADCAPTIGEVDQVTGVAACEPEGLTNKQRATFSFDVVVQPGDLPQIYDYSFVPSGFQTGSSGDPVEITGIDVVNSDGVEFLKQPGREGQLQVDAGVESFRVEVSVTSKGAITGEEALELSLANDRSSVSGTASLADHECKQSAVLETLDGLGYCSDSDDGDTDLSFYYRASFDPGLPTLYGYELGIDNLSLTADYSINDLEFTDLQGDAVDVQVQRESGGIGTILVGKDVSDVVVSVAANATGEITGQEALTLSIGEPQESGGVEDGTGLTASVGFGDYLEICDPLGPQVTSINAQVDCSPDDDENVLVSRFIYDVNLIADNAGPKTYEYSFVPSGFEEDRDDYSVSVIPSEDYSSKDLQSGALQGEIRVAEGVDHFKLEIDIQAGENLVETESLSLTLADERSSEEATASLATSDCIEQVPDSHLYLLMNNSTSMLSPEPSTSQTSAPTMLEAQNRIAFYSFEQAAAKAGFGFRNINDDSFESFGETSTNAILSNSSESLAQTLQDYELVDDPYDGKKAGNLTVYLITYGYIVDYRREDFRSNNLLAGASPGEEGLNLAQRILLTSTPNKIYGNSIENNPNWEAYDLPEPTEDDYFPRNWKELGVNASNLYSGTEMLGAFTGLTHLLRQKRRTNDIQSDESVAITVATDGRPERRPWWDNRDGDGSGVSIPLPESLGGDEITAAGLLYNNDGSFQYNLDNDGVAQWPKMQGKLNKQMDRLAKKLNDPSQQFEVDVIGLGEEDVIGVGADDVVNFPAIYDNLFNEQTFDDSDSTWAYNVIEDLPDFFD